MGTLRLHCCGAHFHFRGVCCKSVQLYLSLARGAQYCTSLWCAAVVCHHQSLGVTTILTWAMLCRLVQLIQDLRVCGSKTLPPSPCKNKEMATSLSFFGSFFFFFFGMFLCIFLFCFLCNSVLLFMRGLSQCKGRHCKTVTTADAFCFSLPFKEIGSDVLAIPH